MQVFIIGSPLETVMAMNGDVRRYNKQIVECQQILDALNGAKAWSNHPCVLQYRGYEEWLREYSRCLSAWKNNDKLTAFIAEQWCQQTRPKWHTPEYFDQMKRRLYTKNPEHYKQWESLGRSDCNWYWSQEENKFIKYINGKRTP